MLSFQYNDSLLCHTLLLTLSRQLTTASQHKRTELNESYVKVPLERKHAYAEDAYLEYVPREHEMLSSQ